MLRKEGPAGLVPQFCVSVAFVLGPSLGYCQSAPPEPPSEAAPKSITLPVATPLKASDANMIDTGPRSYEDGTAPVVGMPYSGIGTTQSATLFLDGNRIVHTETTRFYRDSQGRTRVEHTFLPINSTANSPPIALTVTINDPMSGERYILLPQQKTADTLPWRSGGAMAPPIPAARISLPGLSFARGSSDADSKAVPLGEKLIEGIRVVGTQLEHTVAANVVGNQKPITVTVEQWFSPELGVVIQATHRSTIGSEITYQLEQIARAEPDAALFSVPPDYTRQPYTRREGTVTSVQFAGELSPACAETAKKP